MKHNLLLCTLLLLSVQTGFSQKIPKHIPQDVREELIAIKGRIKPQLENYRINAYSFPTQLSPKFYAWSYFRPKKAQLDSLNLTWQMVYDDDMVKRTLQLLRNEYRQDELDTLVNREMVPYTKKDTSYYNLSWPEREALRIIVNDFAKILQPVCDSLNKRKDRKIYPHYYSTLDVALSWDWHKLPRIQTLADSLDAIRRAEITNRYLNDTIFDMQQLIESCGWVGDKRFVKPLIKIAEESQKESLRTAAVEALRMMKVKPYYSEKYKKEVQEIWCTYSEKLLSTEKMPPRTSEGKDHFEYEDMFTSIKRIITNEDVQAIINAPGFNIKSEEDRIKLYNSMKANCGKFTFVRIW